MKNVFLCYPCGRLYQRGEDRCQSNIESSTSTSMRACNDLGYMASVLREDNNIFLKDYQTEKLEYHDMLNDILVFKPDYLVLSTTNATVFDDIDIVNKLKNDSHLDFKVVLKGAIFFDAEDELLDCLDLKNIDVLVGGEIEFIIKDIISSDDLSNISGIIYKKDDKWIKNDFSSWNSDLDSLPFPARDLMNNSLYIRPDTDEPMATIQTSRGCPSQCIYCMTPIISGKCVRFRSPENVIAEIKECYQKYKIRNFFFKSDTFTINKDWVLRFCDLLKKYNLVGKIAYTVNSRVKPLSEEVVKALSETGCFTIAFGFETGSEKTLKLIKKGTTLDDARKARDCCRKYKLPVFGFFMLGFPWERLFDLNQTRRLIFELDCDFLEVHIAEPYRGTKLYDFCKKSGTLDGEVVGKDYFHTSTNGTKYLDSKFIQDYRKKLLLGYHLRPKYICNKLKGCRDIRVLKNYAKFGLRLVKNSIFKG